VERDAHVGDDLREVERERGRRAGLAVAAAATADEAVGEQDVVVLAELRPVADGDGEGVRLRAEPGRLGGGDDTLVVRGRVLEDLVAARPDDVVLIEPIRVLLDERIDRVVHVPEQGGRRVLARAERVRRAHPPFAGGRGGSGRGRGRDRRRRRGRGGGRRVRSGGGRRGPPSTTGQGGRDQRRHHSPPTVARHPHPPTSLGRDPALTRATDRPQETA